MNQPRTYCSGRTSATITRRRFIGAGLVATTAGLGWPSHLLAAASGTLKPDVRTRDHFTFGLVQWASWQTAPERASEDISRNAERMLAVIKEHAGRCDWLAFDDCPLTGRTPLLDHAARSALALDEGGAVVQRLADAAVKAGCWLSFGALQATRTHPEHVIDAVVVISPEGKTLTKRMPARPPGALPAAASVDLSLIDTAAGVVAVLPHDASPKVVRDCLERGANLLITMNSGPTPSAGTEGSGAQLALAAGVSVLEVRASAPWVEPGCAIDWMGGTRARDAGGNVIGECPHAGEVVLIVTFRAVSSTTA